MGYWGIAPNEGGKVQAHEAILSGRSDLHVDSHCEIEADSGDAEMGFEL
jgi:hypothetical protein